MTVSGGAGNDTIKNYSYGVSIDGGSGNDYIVSGFGTSWGGDGSRAFHKFLSGNDLKERFFIVEDRIRDFAGYFVYFSL